MPRVVEHAVALADVAGRQAATTLSHVCTPPRLRGHDVVDRVGVGAAVLAAVPVAGHHGPPAEGDAPAVRHVHELAQPHDRRHRRRRCARRAARAPVSWTLSAFSAEHEHDGAPGRHGAQRLVRGVEHERPCSHSVRGEASYRRTLRRSGGGRSGAHSSQVTTSSGSGARSGSPYWVSTRNRSHARSGTGRNGRRAHQRSRRQPAGLPEPRPPTAAGRRGHRAPRLTPRSSLHAVPSAAESQAAHVARRMSTKASRAAASPALRRPRQRRARAAAAAGARARTRIAGSSASTVSSGHEGVAEAGADAALDGGVVVGLEDVARGSTSDAPRSTRV